MSDKIDIGVIGAGTMGNGIAQLAATKGHKTIVYDTNEKAIDAAQQKLEKIFNRLIEKGRIDKAEKESIQGRIEWARNLEAMSDCGLIIEAVVENIEVKRSIFSSLEMLVEDDCILASNTSSLSIAAIAAACDNSERVLGLHFFNPAPLMPLVELIPAIQTDSSVAARAKTIVDGWGKTVVEAKDTPGFIVNRVARPFYGEALRIAEEGVADYSTIDWAMKEIGGFRMGPFELMDFIGNDVNYTVTETVFTEFFYDPRYRPAFTQKRLMEAGWLGRKSGIGYYDYREGANNPEPNRDEALGNAILDRVVCMLINEAADALFLNIASRDDIDLAMTRGVNYPKGLLKWADELGVEKVLKGMEELRAEYCEDRYRPSPMLRRMAAENKTFY